METKYISLYEIDPDVIADIRPVKENKEGYKILEEAMKQDGQFTPITIRYLNDEEKAKAKECAIYGIIDGHHRFNIAKNNNWEKILANIDTIEPSPLRDAMLAFRLNNTAIRMTVEEKGKAIEQLMNLTGQKANTIGETIFGLKTAMAYRCVQAYKNKKQHENKKESVGKCTFNANDLHNAINNIPNENPNLYDWDINKCIEQLEVIKKAESELRFYKRELLNKAGVKSKWAKYSKNQSDDNN